jgi:hypothetical protein
LQQGLHRRAKHRLAKGWIAFRPRPQKPPLTPISVFQNFT